MTAGQALDDEVAVTGSRLRGILVGERDAFDVHDASWPAHEREPGAPHDGAFLFAALQSDKSLLSE